MNLEKSIIVLKKTGVQQTRSFMCESRSFSKTSRDQKSPNLLGGSRQSPHLERKCKLPSPQSPRTGNHLEDFEGSRQDLSICSEVDMRASVDGDPTPAASPVSNSERARLILSR